MRSNIPVIVPMRILNSFVSKMRFKICLVIEVSSSEAMDLPTKGLVNFWGPPGTGKTSFFKNIKHVSFDHDILKTKERTDDFLHRMKYSKLPLVLDDFEMVESLIGVSELKELKVPFYVITNEKSTTLKFTSYYQHLGIDIQKFADSIGLRASEAARRLKDANGNMKTVELDTTFFGSTRDVKTCPKEYVKTLLTQSSCPSLTYMLDRTMTEHGNTFGMLHENYIDYIKTCDSAADICDSFSYADIIDRDIYTDISWDLVTFFNISACLIPSLCIKEDYNKNTKTDIKPGSIWTKYSNACMKKNRLKRLKVGRECIYLYIMYLNKGLKCPTQFDSYNLDTMNQLSLIEKINPKILAKMKVELKSSIS
jgi:hypothetical protein